MGRLVYNTSLKSRDLRIIYRYNLPLLHAVEALEGWDGDKDDNSLLAVANFDLIKTQSQQASSRTHYKVCSLDRFPSYTTI